jgi:transcriptional regulator with XRE-family HTH domain
MDPEEALRRLGGRIRSIRKQRRLSRRVVAELAGIHENTLKAIENGHGNPTYRVLQKIADVLAVEIRELLGE